ncbi:MAG: insulinase family protein [Bacteroidales bacterium]|nr:insulinase family protein [Bacteroidales bacterium]
MNIPFEKKVLANGLKVLVHKDTTTPMAAFNLLYDVGSKDEHPSHTGLAHLLEHLMFGGTRRFPDFDEVIEGAGGENNAFTNNDFTNYYLQMPKDRLELAFEVESDRMRNLVLSPKKVGIQKDVVIEEFKERYLNRPYGDVDLLLRPLCYTRHPYAWATIGKETAHIADMPIAEIKSFYNRYYRPDNAILAVAGPVEAEEVFALSEKWFGGILAGGLSPRTLTPEPEQTEARRMEVVRDVPYSTLYKVYHIGERMSPDFYVFDLISDLFSNGKSSRFYVELVKKQRLFNELDAYVSADIEPGTFYIRGRLNEGVGYAEAEAALQAQIDTLATQLPPEHELEKIKNKLETALLFSNLKALDKATNLCYFELMGGAGNLSAEMEKYAAVDGRRMQAAVKRYLREENATTLYYTAKS